MSEYDPADLTGQRPESGETQRRLDAARAQLNAAYEATRAKSAQALDQAEAFVRKSPLEAVGYAAGIGAVIGLVAGLLLGRKE